MKLLSDFKPKLFLLIEKGITRKQIINDITAGIIVGIIALPLAIAFGIASGVSPEKGIITAIIAGFIISFFGGSRVQIGGPTGAFIILVYSIIQKHGLNGLLIATFMAGIILILMGLLKFGSLLKYIPQTLIVGFTSGIAVIIFTTQIKDFFGLKIESLPADFFNKWVCYFNNFNTLNFWTLGIGLFTIFTILISPKIFKKIPGSFLALMITTIFVYFFNIPVETIYSKFGSISTSLPTPAFFNIDFETIKNLLLPAFVIALLGALESLLSAVVADGMIGGKHKSNTELLAQGLANLIVPLFGGIPATGAIARTATNIKNGGQTPIAGIIHSITLLIIFLVAMPLVKFVPIPTLAGILIVVAWNMSELDAFKRIFKVNRYESAVLITTFLLTIFTDLTIAITIGFILSILLFMKRMSDSVDITPLIFSKKSDDKIFNEEIGNISDEILIFELNGPLFFGAVSQFLNIEKHIKTNHKIIILRMRYVPIIDTTGLNRLTEINSNLKNNNIQLIISGANEKIEKKLLNLNILEKEYITKHIKESIIIANNII